MNASRIRVGDRTSGVGDTAINRLGWLMAVLLPQKLTVWWSQIEVTIRAVLQQRWPMVFAPLARTCVRPVRDDRNRWDAYRAPVVQGQSGIAHYRRSGSLAQMDGFKE